MKQLLNCILVSIWIVFAAFPAYSQDSANDLNFNPGVDANSRIHLPKSPEAEAFEKYGNTGVNLYSGTPQITIPLHTFKGTELNVSMALDYDATGVKVPQIATNAGLGWNLTLGGRISRIANGKPDDLPGGPYDEDVSLLMSQYYGVYSFGSDYELQTYLDEYLLPASSGQIDTELDFYSINVNGISDYMIRDTETGSFYTLMNPRIQVEYYGSTGWKVTGEDGTEYYFGEHNKVEHTQVSGGDDVGSGSSIYNGNSTTSWLLTTIRSKNKIDTFEFDYKLYTWANTLGIPATSKMHARAYNCSQLWYTVPSYNMNITYKTSQQMPLSIKQNNAFVAKFTYKARQDLALSANSYQGGNALDRILFYKYKAEVNEGNFDAPVDESMIFKKIAFVHSYFGPTGSISATANRLMLESLIFSSAPDVKKYSFEYDRPHLVPKINSYSQDFLGLYNGAGNADLVPTVKFGSRTLSGANRDTNMSYSTIGMLKKIVYPTKGYTVFTYEQNKVSDNVEIPEHQVEHPYSAFHLDSPPYICGDYPDYETKHPNMTNISTAHFGIFGIGGTQTFYPSTVATSLLTVNEATDNFQITGLGLYLIQRINSCNNVTDEDSFPGCSDYYSDPNLLYTCLHPTTELYITGTNTYSYPADFVAGGLTFDYLPPHLVPGRYQVTLWTTPMPVEMGEPISDYVNASLTAYTYTTAPQHTEYHTKDSYGIRIKTIKDYSSKDKFASEKEYKYGYDINDGNNSSGENLGLPPGYSVYMTRYVTCPPSNPFADHGVVEDIPSIVVPSTGILTLPNVGYGSVFEIAKDSLGNNNGYTQTKFHVGVTGLRYSDGPTSYDPVFSSGKVKEKKVFDNESDLRLAEEFTYSDGEDESLKFFELHSSGFRKNSDNAYAYAAPPYWGLFYDMGTASSWGITMPGPVQYPSSWPGRDNFWYDTHLGKYSFHRMSQDIFGKYGYITSKATTAYPISGGEVSQTENYFYDSGVPFMLLNKSTQTSEGRELTEIYTYSPDYPYNPEKVVDKMITASGEMVSEQYNVYSDFVGPANLVTEIQTSKGTNPLEPRVIFDYDPVTKNIISVLKLTNVANPAANNYESYIYGYDGKLPVAKLSGVKYSQIPQNLLDDIAMLSSRVVSEVNDTALRGALNVLRTTFPAALITTFTYDPMIAVTSQTEPNGLVKFFEYDELGRLKRVRDQDNNILSENQYHYKN